MNKPRKIIFLDNTKNYYPDYQSIINEAFNLVIRNDKFEFEYEFNDVLSTYKVKAKLDVESLTLYITLDFVKNLKTD